VTWRDPTGVGGFAPIYDKASSSRYHKLYIRQDYWAALVDATQNPYDRLTYPIDKTAYAILVLIHEAYHYRLNSGDEGRVNACALRDFPTVLTKQFGISPTKTRVDTMPRWVKVWYRVKVRGHWVKRYRWKVIYDKTVTTTVENEVFTRLVNSAKFQYSQEPPPYNSGTCS
jgi:hypothetical protein